MRKEVLYAVIFGIALGGIILFGINLANKSVSNLESEPEGTPAEASTPTPTVAKKSLEIITPQNNAVISSKNLTLVGKATPSTNLAIVTESDDLLITSSPEGTFSAQVNLIPGENTLTVTNLLNDKTIETLVITVIQSSTLPE
jgi:hypothetical protein